MFAVGETPPLQFGYSNILMRTSLIPGIFSLDINEKMAKEKVYIFSKKLLTKPMESDIISSVEGETPATVEVKHLQLLR